MLLLLASPAIEPTEVIAELHSPSEVFACSLHAAEDLFITYR
jgi:hypothetical protein